MSEELDRPLKPFEAKFVQEYIKTSNATESMQRAKPNLKRTSAGVRGSNALQNVRIRSAIQQTAKRLGLTDKFLLDHLRSQLISPIQSEQVRYDSEGNVLERVAWKRSPTPSEAAKVVDVINRSTGLYELNRAAGQALSSQFKALAKRYQPVLSKRGAKHKQTPPGIVQADVKVLPDDVYESIQCAMVGGMIVVLDEADA